MTMRYWFHLKSLNIIFKNDCDSVIISIFSYQSKVFHNLVFDMEVGSRYNSHCNWATNFSLWKNIQQYDIPTSLLLSLRRTRMAQRQNTTFYGLRKIWQVSKGFGNIVCISENLKKKLESSVTRTNVLYIFICTYNCL